MMKRWELGLSTGLFLVGLGLAATGELRAQQQSPAVPPGMTKAEAAVNASFGQFTRDLKAYEDEHRAELVAAERDRLAAEKALADLRAAIPKASAAPNHLMVGSPPPAGAKR
jgi:hypothetical protein